jgi:hypothetical protein
MPARPHYLLSHTPCPEVPSQHFCPLPLSGSQRLSETSRSTRVVLLSPAPPDLLAMTLQLPA